jgi:hypothetical protein
VVHLFPGGGEGALFLYDIYSFEYICLFIILPGYRFCRFFFAFRCFLVVYLVPLCQLYMSEMLFSTFLMRLFGVVSSPWKMLHLCIVNVSEVIIKTVFIKKEK